MTFVIALQLLFPALAAGYLISSWRGRNDLLGEPDRDDAPVRPVSIVPWNAYAARRCARSLHRADWRRRRPSTAVPRCRTEPSHPAQDR